MFPNDRKETSDAHEQSRESFHKGIDDDQAPTYSPSASRRRPGKAVTSDSGFLQHSENNQTDTGSRLPLVSLLNAVAVDLWTKVTTTCVLVTCVSALSWASLIVWLLGPAVPVGDARTADGSQLPLEQPGAFPIHINEDDGTMLPGWTPLGHHARFVGRAAFPKIFKRWEQEGEVVINSVDVGPLAADGKVLPKTDLLLAILSGNGQEARLKRDTLREVYDKYDGVVRVGGTRSTGTYKESLDVSFRLVFVVTRPTAPPNGELVGDVLYVNAPDGYRNIVYKVKHMMGLVRHIDFKFLLKADDDTFICMERLVNFLYDQSEETVDKIYAGVPTACDAPSNPVRGIGRVIKNPKDKWFDQKFVDHTLAGLDCYPVYMQGAFYVLAHPLVEHLYRGREHYATFVNEDVTVGSWLLGVDKTLGTIHDFGASRLWNCVCGSTIILRPTVRKEQVFFHDCKKTSQLRSCSHRLVRPQLQC